MSAGRSGRRRPAATTGSARRRARAPGSRTSGDCGTPAGRLRLASLAVPTPIIIDCDPGHDDAIAILLALASPEVELLGITTVAGNATLERTTANALRVLDLVGR